MREAIKILRQELVFCTRFSELFEELETVLKQNASGNGVSKIVQKLEKGLTDVPKLEAEQKSFLETVKQPTLRSFLEAQPDSVERTMALRLLEQVVSLQEKLRQQSAKNHLLLERSKQFIDFHMNVISRTTANPTYGPPGADGVEHRRGRRMFDQNV